MEKTLFTPLTPIDNVELGIYKDALDFVFSNDEVRNIAVSGAYGSGKSSILATYEKQTNTEFLHISLAHFAQNDNDKTPNADEQAINHSYSLNISTLEWKILNQLIHQIKPSKIPQTNFRIKKNTSKLGVAGVTAMMFVFISSFLYTIMFYKWISFYNTLNSEWLKHIFRFTASTDFRLITLILSVGMGGLALFKLLMLQHNRRIIQKLNVKGAEIEMFSESDESYFDRYLNEVLYLFENIKQNVIVFEDIDRFDSNVIFERLREVNTLVNYSRKPNIVQKILLSLTDNKIIKFCITKFFNNKYVFPPMRFFYLIRDDIFLNKDRTKFFDLIIPVIPIVDGSNSYDKFIDVFKQHNILEHFNSSFLQGLSFYIDEMRLLLNICNEYKIYYHQIGNAGTEIDLNKLLAMIALKNIFPLDFAELQLGRGFVARLLALKNNLMRLEQTRLENEIDDLEIKIESAKNEHLQSINEVDILYSERLHNLGEQFYAYYTNLRKDRNYSAQQAMIDRKTRITDRSDEKQTAILSEILQRRRQLTSLRSKRIKDLLTPENIDDIFVSVEYVNPLDVADNFEDVKQNSYFPLLKFLIRNGYIDETYKDYITYFYPNSLSANDVAFCRSVTDQNTNKSPGIIIDNPAMVVNRLPAEYFKQMQVLNYSLLNYLLANKNPSEQLTLLIEQLTENKLFDFICEYFMNDHELEKFVTVINKVWPTLFGELRSDKKLGDEYLNIFARYTLYGSTDEVIEAVNVKACLTDFISNNAIFLRIDKPQNQRILNGLKLLKVSFAALKTDNVDPLLLNDVYENCLYKITFDNISIMLHNFYKLEVSSEFKHRNYSLILSNPSSPLAKFVNDNLVNYIGEILENCEDKITDEETVALSVLNNEIVPINLRQRYISLLKTKLAALTEVNNRELWTDLVKANEAIIYSEKNVIDYCSYANDEFDDVLIKWINQQTSRLHFTDKSLFNDGDNEREKFIKAVVLCNKLSDAKYSEFINNLSIVYGKFDLESIVESKMNILFDEDVIEMNAENLVFIRSGYPFEILCRFITKYIDGYTQILGEQGDLLAINELEYIISTKSGILEDKQLKLLTLIGNNLSIRGKPYTEPIQIHILMNNFSEDDYELLVKNYDSFSGEKRKAVVGLCIGRIEKTIELMYPISKIFFDDLANSKQLQEKQIHFILALALPSIGEPDCIRYLTSYGLSQFTDIFDNNKRPQFDDTKLNKFVLECFVRWGKIKEYNVRENEKIHIKH